MEAERVKRNGLQKPSFESPELCRETETALQAPAVPEDSEHKRLAALFRAVNDNPCAQTLGMIYKREQTSEIVKIAVAADGMALREASKLLVDYDLCKTAVQQNGLALRYVQKTYPQFLTDEMIEIAVKNNALAIAHVPPVKITKRLAQIAVRQPVEEKHFRNTGINKYPIGYIPDQFIDEQLVSESVMYSPRSIRHVPRRFLTRSLWKQAISIEGAVLGLLPEEISIKDIELVEISFASDPENIRFVPKQLRSKKKCEEAFKKNPLLIECFPEEFITIEMCLAAIKAPDPDNRFGKLRIEWIPQKYWNEPRLIKALKEKFGEEYLMNWNGGLLLNQTIPLPKLTIIEEPTPPPASDAELVPYNHNQIVSYDFVMNCTDSAPKMFYITDIHIEHQFKELFTKENGSFHELTEIIDLKLKDMISTLQWEDRIQYLLVGGDVSYSKEIVSLFYKRLRRIWYGPILSVLGNHELWDDHPEGIIGGHISRPIEEIISDYRERINTAQLNGTFLLQNALFMNYKNEEKRVIEEEQILSVSDEELKAICMNSAVIILGGVGFSGLNAEHNATKGYYRSAVTTLEQDIELSRKFEQIYEKVNRCAGDMQVIVLTHTSVSDWLSMPVNPKWIYINGHTHHNSVVRKQDGTTILSDNQIGYTPKKWKLNAFTIAGWYDPFREMEDGINRISLQAYDEFNRGRNIVCKGYGEVDENTDIIFVLKKKDIYMFVLQKSSGLYLLKGGKISNKLEKSTQYYYEHMETFAHTVKEGITEISKMLKSISDEVKRFGGDGRIHGSIVDINFCCHIMLNPIDGTITPYYAPDSASPDYDSMYLYTNHLFFLLNDHAPSLCSRFIKSRSGGVLPLLGQYAGYNTGFSNNLPAFAPLHIKREEAKKIYELSEKMRAYEYLDNNVIRIWNDEIMKAGLNATATTLLLQ